MSNLPRTPPRENRILRQLEASKSPIKGSSLDSYSIDEILDRAEREGILEPFSSNVSPQGSSLNLSKPSQAVLIDVLPQAMTLNEPSQSKPLTPRVPEELAKGSLLFLKSTSQDIFESSDSESEDEESEPNIPKTPTPIDMSSASRPKRPKAKSSPNMLAKKDYYAIAIKKSPPPPPKPVLIERPSQEQYKNYMRERYEYEKWENAVLLLSRRLEQKDIRKNKVKTESMAEIGRSSLATSTLRSAKIFANEEKVDEISPSKKTSPGPSRTVSVQSLLEISWDNQDYQDRVLNEFSSNYEKVSNLVKKKSLEFQKERREMERELTIKQNSELKSITHRLTRESDRSIKLLEENQIKQASSQVVVYLNYDENELPTLKNFRQQSEKKMNMSVHSRIQTRQRLSAQHQLAINQMRDRLKTKKEFLFQRINLWVEKSCEFHRVAQETTANNMQQMTSARHQQETRLIQQHQNQEKTKFKEQLEKQFNQKQFEIQLKNELKEKEKELIKQGKDKKSINQVLSMDTLSRSEAWNKKKASFIEQFNQSNEEILNKMRKKFEQADQAELKVLETKELSFNQTFYDEIRLHFLSKRLEAIELIQKDYEELITTASNQYQDMTSAIQQDFELDLNTINQHFQKTFEFFEKDSNKEMERIVDPEKKKNVLGIASKNKPIDSKAAREQTTLLHQVYKQWSEAHSVYQQQAIDSLELRMIQERKQVLDTYCKDREHFESERLLRIKETLEEILDLQVKWSLPIWRRSTNFTLNSDGVFKREMQIELEKQLNGYSSRSLKLANQKISIELEKFTKEIISKQELRNKPQETESIELPLFDFDQTKDFSTIRYDKYIVPPRETKIGAFQCMYQWNFNYTFVRRNGSPGENGVDATPSSRATSGTNGCSACSETIYLIEKDPTTLLIQNKTKELSVEFRLPIKPLTSYLNPPVLKLNYCGGDGGNGGHGLQFSDSFISPEFSNGADGGAGGDGGRVMVVSKNPELFNYIHIDVSGGLGGLGGVYGKFGQTGRAGVPGNVEYCISNEKGEIIKQCSQPPSAYIVDYNIGEDLNSLDMVIEPGEAIVINNIRICNPSLLPLPAGCLLYFRSTQMITMDSIAFCLPEIPPRSEILVPGSFTGHITDSHEPNISGTYIRTAPVLGVVARGNIPFQDGCLVKAIQIRFPLCFEQISYPSQLAPQERGMIELCLKNISTRAYAKPDEKSTRAALWIHFPKGLTPLTAQPLSETPEGKVLKFPLQTLSPDTSHSYKVEMHLDKKVELYQRLVCKAEIYLRGKVIEYRTLTVRVSTPYFTSFGKSGDILLVTPPEFTRNDYLTWIDLTKNLNMRLDIWDLEHQRGLHHIRHHKSWVGQYPGKIIVLPTLLPGCERDLIEHLLSTDQEQTLTEVQLKARDEEEKKKPEQSVPIVLEKTPTFIFSTTTPLSPTQSTFNIPTLKGPASGIVLLSILPNTTLIDRFLKATSVKTEKLSEVLIQPPTQQEIEIKATQLTEEYRRLDPLHLYGIGTISTENNRIMTRTGQEAWGYGTFSIPFLPVRKSSHFVQCHHQTPISNDEDQKFAHLEDGGYTIPHSSKYFHILVSLMMALPLERLVLLAANNSFSNDHKWLFRFKERLLTFHELLMVCMIRLLDLDTEIGRSFNFQALIKAITARPKKFQDPKIALCLMVSVKHACEPSSLKQIETLLSPTHLSREIELCLSIPLPLELLDDLPLLHPFMQGTAEFIFESRSKKILPVSDRSFYGQFLDPNTSINQQICKMANSKLSKYLEKFEAAPLNLTANPQKPFTIPPKMELKVDNDDGTPIFPMTPVETESICDYLG